MPSQNTAILYSYDDKPNPANLLTLGLQYILKFSLLLICPVLIAKAAGASLNTTNNLISITLIISALSTLAFAIKKIGGGYFLPTQASTVFFALALASAQAGGLGLVATLGLIAGVTQLICAPFVAKLDGPVSHECCALILFMMGLWAAELGVSEFFHPGLLGNLIIHGHNFGYEAISWHAAIPGYFTLACLLILKPWRHYRSHAIFIAMLLGITLGWLISSTPTARLITQQNLSWLYLPQLLPYNQLHFHYSWLAPAILLGVLSSLETLTLSKTLDQRLSRPYHAKRQLKTQLVSATTTCLTGLTASPVSIIPGSIGDMLTSDSYSRHIAWIYSAALLALAFTPKVSGLLLLIPASVNGAVIIFMGSIMLLQALKNLNLNSMPARRAQVFGLGITVGIASLQLPPLVTTIHNHNPWITNPASLYSLASIGILLSLLKLRGVLHAH